MINNITIHIDKKIGNINKNVYVKYITNKIKIEMNKTDKNVKPVISNG